MSLTFVLYYCFNLPSPLIPGSDKWEAPKRPAQGNRKRLQAKAVHNLLCSATTACTNLSAPRDGHSWLTTSVSIVHLGRVQDNNVLAPPKPQPP